MSGGERTVRSSVCKPDRMNGIGIVERAYQLAQSGTYTSMAELKRRLSLEGYTHVDAHLHGVALRNALIETMRRFATPREESRQRGRAGE